MTRIKTWAALFAACCSALAASAERVAPAFPAFSQPESGKAYCLYNVGTQQFLTGAAASNSNQASISTYGDAVLLEAAESGSYTFLLTEKGKYINAGGYSTVWSDDSSIGNECYWTVSAIDDGYAIQKAPENKNNYNATHFLGVNNSSLSCTLTEGSLAWKFVPAEEAQRYFALHRLYTALEAMNGTGFDIEKFETVYDDPASTDEELNAAASSLTGALDIASKLKFPDWSEYPILIENDPVNPSQFGDGRDYIYILSDGNVSQQFTATIVVDKEATLVYNADFERRGAIFKVYIDGTLARNIEYDQSYDDRRYMERLAPGKHTVVFRLDCSNGEGGMLYLRNIGVMATPLISVNLLEPGSLGTEVLYNVDHVKNVRGSR